MTRAERVLIITLCGLGAFLGLMLNLILRVLL